ncbi:hypothetical protein LCGC14_2245920 [marine sediment metagenome]|uniref:Uncharacterized protein n=1 Tax=marine sediment metagenome TaxID=412755 RepID=A0A0F9FGL7_9ZZZZ
MTSVDEAASAYLAGYLERGGAVRIYVNRLDDKEALLIETSHGEVSPIESAGIYVRVRSEDMTILRFLKGAFGGNLSKGQWQGWNEEAATLLRVITPYLRTGKRKALVQLALEFHEFIEMKRGWATESRLFFTAEDVEVIARYEMALKEITGSQ